MSRPHDPLLELLACPRCDAALESTANGHRCAGCRVDFASLDGIPWLFAEPGAALGEWRARLHFALRRLEQDVHGFEAALAANNLRASSRERLAWQKQATEDQKARLAALLAPLALGDLGASHESHLALRTRLPIDQGLTTYYGNVHRDWSWGERENAESHAIVSARLGGADPGRMLVLGAGAARLAYDLHMRSTAALTIALDFNPLLLLAARRITSGERVALYEFPIAPRSGRDHAVLRELAAPSPVRAGFHYVLADAHRPPFRAAAFDTVVTPWLVDILPERFDALCGRINSLLAPGGRWVNFGSLSFHTADPSLRYGVDECIAALGENGFNCVATSEHEIPYMCSPASRHGRHERVVTWTAHKHEDAPKIARYQALPDWIVRGTEPVPLSDSFRMQATTTRIYAFVMSMIDGRRTLKDMAKLVSDQNVMTRDEAESSIRSFLIKMYEDARRGPGL